MSSRPRGEIRKEVLWESATVSRSEVRRVEVAFIRELRANHPAIGCTRWPPVGLAPKNTL